MIFTVGNTKGGVGKSTLAVQLAVMRATAGSDVWLIDGDRQGTTHTAMCARAEANQAPGIACGQYVEGPALRAQVLHQSKKFDDIIIDAGGRDSTALRAALTLSNVLLVPFQPRTFDVWALQDMAALIDEARSVRDGLIVYAVLNDADPNVTSTDNAEAAAYVARFPQFEYLDTPIRGRKAFANSAGQGMSVFELKKRDPKAEAEIQRLYAAIFQKEPAVPATE